MNNIVSDLVNGLGSYTVFSYGDAEILSEKDVLVNGLKQFDGRGSIIVINESDLEGRDPQTVLDQVLANQKDGSGFLTNPASSNLIMVIKSEGSNSFLVASENLEAKEALEEVLGESVDTDPGLYLLDNMPEMIEASFVTGSAVVTEEVVEEDAPVEEEVVEEVIPEPAVDTETSEVVDVYGNPVEPKGSSNPFINAGFSVLVLAVVVYIVYKLFSKSKAKGAALKPSKEQAKAEKESLVGLKKHPELEEELIALNSNVSFQLGLDHSRMVNCAKDLMNLRNDFVYLFNLAEAQENVTIGNNIAVEYNDMFSRLNPLVSADYWGDLVKNPNHWKNTSKRIDDVREGIAVAQKMVLNNTQQIKEKSSLKFDIDLKLILAKDDAVSLDDFISPEKSR